MHVVVACILIEFGPDFLVIKQLKVFFFNYLSNENQFWKLFLAFTSTSALNNVTLVFTLSSVAGVHLIITIMIQKFQTYQITKQMADVL